jgi:hypothetical protein
VVYIYTHTYTYTHIHRWGSSSALDHVFPRFPRHSRRASTQRGRTDGRTALERDVQSEYLGVFCVYGSWTGYGCRVHEDIIPSVADLVRVCVYVCMCVVYMFCACMLVCVLWICMYMCVCVSVSRLRFCSDLVRVCVYVCVYVAYMYVYMYMCVCVCVSRPRF